MWVKVDGVSPLCCIHEHGYWETFFQTGNHSAITGPQCGNIKRPFAWGLPVPSPHAPREQLGVSRLITTGLAANCTQWFMQSYSSWFGSIIPLITPAGMDSTNELCGKQTRNVFFWGISQKYGDFVHGSITATGIYTIFQNIWSLLNLQEETYAKKKTFLINVIDQYQEMTTMYMQK